MQRQFYTMYSVMIILLTSSHFADMLDVEAAKLQLHGGSKAATVDQLGRDYMSRYGSSMASLMAAVSGASSRY